MSADVKPAYDPRNLQSLFGYGRKVHERSGGICQLCSFGSGGSANAELWRQLTVEHLIGEGQGGYPPRIRAAVDLYLSPSYASAKRTGLARDIHLANMITACHFCNATTSRDHSPFSMEEVIARAAASANPVLLVAQLLEPVREAKVKAVAIKLQTIRAAFDREIGPRLNSRRAQLAERTTTGRAPSFPGTTDTARAVNG